VNQLTTYISAGYAALYAVTHEEDRITSTILSAAKDIKCKDGKAYEVWQWTITSGLMNSEGETIDKTADPLAMLTAFIAHNVNKDTVEPEGTHIPNKSIVILKDFHLFLKSPPPLLIRKLKEAISVGRASNRCLIIMGCVLHLPPELEKEVAVIEFTLPTRDELRCVAESVAKSANQILNGNTDAILDAMSGLTTSEASDAAAYSVVEKGEIESETIAEIKSKTLKKGGILEVIKPGVTFADLGGLTELKSWVSKRKRAFTSDAEKYGLPRPRGVCLYGIQGAGKSFATRAIASELGCPLIKLDAGKLFGGLVGSSEANVRSVIQQVEAFGKCALMIDEIDKGFAGMTGGHDGDSGTTRRVIGTFLTWMSDKTSPVFIVATANDLTRLPPELLRKGRWDELFFIDLPTTSERVEIWKVQIRRRNRKHEAFDLDALASATNEWTGAEIEALFGEGLYHAFDAGVEPTTELLVTLSKDTMPLSKTMAEPMANLRQWSVGRSRLASLPEVKNKAVAIRKMA
jgi:AAA+ superfamily predicted ATPase